MKLDQKQLKGIILRGAIAGLIGGLFFGAALFSQNELSYIAQLIGSDSPIAGIVIHLLMSILNGVLFSLLIKNQTGEAGEIMFWGLIFGVTLWFWGPLTVHPIVVGGFISWKVSVLQKVLPSLMGHLWYGAITALVLTYLRKWSDSRSIMGKTELQAGLKGMIIGLIAFSLLRILLSEQFQLFAGSTSSLLMMATITGLIFGVLYPHPVNSSGGNIIRGMVFGFFAWIAGPLTLQPLLSGLAIDWTITAVRASFSGLIAFFIFGALLALLYQWSGNLFVLLFREVRKGEGEGYGTQGVRGLVRGIIAGTVGGILFTFVMVQVGILPMVANLVNSDSSTTGFIIHLFISILIGISYGLLFKHQSVDLSSAMGWGLSYGFFWWIFGGLTLFPLMLGGTPQWSADAVGMAFASLIGHLAYGAALGITSYLIERRQNPWWISKEKAELAKIDRQITQLRSSAPALWALVAIFAVFIPAVVAVLS